MDVWSPMLTGEKRARGRQRLLFSLLAPALFSMKVRVCEGVVDLCNIIEDDEFNDGIGVHRSSWSLFRCLPYRH